MLVVIVCVFVCASVRALFPTRKVLSILLRTFAGARAPHYVSGEHAVVRITEHAEYLILLNGFSITHARAQFNEAEREMNLILKGFYTPENCPPRLAIVHSIALVYHFFRSLWHLSAVLRVYNEIAIWLPPRRRRWSASAI